MSREVPSLSSTDEYNQLWARTDGSVTRRKVARAVLGDEYPEGADIDNLTRSALGWLVRGLGVGAGQRLVDLGCGAGNVGLWVARETGAALVGVDVSEAAIARATRRAASAALAAPAAFRVTDILSTGLPAGTFDGAMCLHALHLTADQAAALREMARLLRAGGRLALMTWVSPVTPPGRPPQVDDLRPLLVAAGFAVDSYEEDPAWVQRFRAQIEGGLAARADFIAEMGEEQAERHMAALRGQLVLLDYPLRYVSVLATREGTPPT